MSRHHPQEDDLTVRLLAIAREADEPPNLPRQRRPLERNDAQALRKPDRLTGMGAGAAGVHVITH